MMQVIVSVLLCASALALPSCEKRPELATRKAHAKWVKVEDDNWQSRNRTRLPQNRASRTKASD